MRKFSPARRVNIYIYIGLTLTYRIHDSTFEIRETWNMFATGP